MKLSQQNVSFSSEFDIESPKLVPIISYPRFSPDEYSARISEMRSLGVSSISLGGRTIVNGLPITGKGCVGLVVRARIDNKIYALKIRRIDADRKSMDAEAHFHKIANSAGVGPQLKGHTKNFLAMEFAEGKSIIDWVVGVGEEEEDSTHNNNNNNNNNNNITTTKSRTASSVIRAILEQCRSLDRARLDHGELSRLDRHVVVSRTPVIIDFESASTVRKTCNVTAATQSILLYGPVAIRMQKILGMRWDRAQIINALKIYKQDQSDYNFRKVLDSFSI